MSDQQSDQTNFSSVPQPKVSEEFFIRVNDFIEMANRIERRFDTLHAVVVMMHAFARYSAHHYRSTDRNDTIENRQEFADYMGTQVRSFVMSHLNDIAGQLPMAAADQQSDSGEATGA